MTSSFMVGAVLVNSLSEARNLVTRDGSQDILKVMSEGRKAVLIISLYRM